MVGFDNGSENNRILNGETVENINSDLTGQIDLTEAVELPENDNLAFLGIMKAGAFDLDKATANSLLEEAANPNGKPNSDVVRLRLIGENITKGTEQGWIIDFGVSMSEDDASRYEKPFAYVEENIMPSRLGNRRKKLREQWWIHGEARPGLRQAIGNLTRCIVTPEVSKYRHFHWMETSVVPDQTLHVIARDDDYFFGVLHSRPDELWSLAVGNHMGVGNDPRYNSKRTFRTFPLPWPPGEEPVDSFLVKEIAETSRRLVEERNISLQSNLGNKRTMTSLYNKRPTWLTNAHDALDRAVFAAYGWSKELSDEEILTNLLALNAQRAAK